jgi:hypothetical protein
MKSYWEIQGRIAGKAKAKWESKGGHRTGPPDKNELETMRNNFRNWEFRIKIYRIETEIIE